MQGGRVGPYELVGELGRGGAAIVFAARDSRVAGPELVALKLFQPGLLATHRRRVQREIEAMRRLRHPHLLSLLDAGETRGSTYLVTPLIKGQSLQDLLDHDGPLEQPLAARLTAQLAQGLAQAHALGVIHRDLKPENVLLDQRQGRIHPLLADFGLARDLDLSLSGTQLTREGFYLGTPGYWPPEQATGRVEDMGPSGDVYGLGGLLFAMLTGESPQGEPSTMLEAVANAERPVRRPSRLRKDLDARLEKICLRCLEVLPGDRFRDAAEVAAELQAWTPPGRGSSWAADLGRQPARIPALVSPLALTAALILLLGAGTAALLITGASARSPGTGAAAASPSPSARPALPPLAQPRVGQLWRYTGSRGWGTLEFQALDGGQARVLLRGPVFNRDDAQLAQGTAIVGIGKLSPPDPEARREAVELAGYRIEVVVRPRPGGGVELDPVLPDGRAGIPVGVRRVDAEGVVWWELESIELPLPEPRPGQRWRFRGPQGDAFHEVSEVRPDGTVFYRSEGAGFNAPGETSLPYGGFSSPSVADPAWPREVLALAQGRYRVRCAVETRDDGSRAWHALNADGRQAFPREVRVEEADGRLRYELVGVSE